MSKHYLDKDKEFIWHPYTALSGVLPHVFIESAKGLYLHTSEGRQIMDIVSSWWVNLHGHSNEYIADAISKQARTLEHVIFAGFTHGQAVTLAERLVSILPGDQKKIFYSDNGSTAVEAGLKMAFQYWYNSGTPKHKVIAIDGAFHGDTFGSMSVGERGIFTKPFQPLLFETSFIDFPVEGKESVTIDQFEKLAQGGDIAAFIYEPLVQGAAGMRIYSQEVLDQLLKIAQENNIICIADEVMTGFGRTGKLFASEHMVHKPDIICMSKGITGGVMALGATSCNAKIIAAFEHPEKEKIFFHGHSFTANPMACAAANASLDLLLKQECQEKIQMISASHIGFLPELKSLKSVAQAKAFGTILSIEISSSQSTGYLNNLRDYLYERFLEQDILVRPLGNIIYLLPPYIIDEKELKKAYKIVVRVLTNLASGS